MKNIQLSEETQKRIDNAPLFAKTAINTLLKCIDDLLGNKCSENDVASAISQLNDNANDRFSDHELLNYDEAGRLLGFGTTNRIALKKLLDKHNIKQVVMNNTKVGFPAYKVYELKRELSKR